MHFFFRSHFIILLLLCNKSEIHQLSVKDRNDIQEEIHGVNSMAVEENPQIVDNALTELRMEISFLPPAERAAYDRAVFQLNSRYIQSKEFGLKFLRADLFDIKKAATRIAIHVGLLLEFFGDVGLVRPLRWDDLTKEVQDGIKEGKIQILPSRDRAGRLVVMFLHGMKTNSRNILVSNCYIGLCRTTTINNIFAFCSNQRASFSSLSFITIDAYTALHVYSYFRGHRKPEKRGCRNNSTRI
jgi:hypothetical protein